MTVVAKRAKTWKSKIVPGKAYPIDEALGLVKEFAKAKFNEAVDVAVNLGIDATKSDQQVRGSTVMPHGIGKTVRVAVFTSGKKQEAAKAAGADIVGLEDLAESISVFRYYAGAADKITGRTIETSPAKLAYVLQEPLGVCGQIIPWYVQTMNSVPELSSFQLSRIQTYAW